MKPKHREILNLALGCWADFLPHLTSPFLSKSLLPNQTLFKLFDESHPDIKNAIALLLFTRRRTRIPEHIIQWSENSWNRGVCIYTGVFLRDGNSRSICLDIYHKTQSVILGANNIPNHNTAFLTIQEQLEQLSTTPDPNTRACLNIRMVLEGFKPCFHPLPPKTRRKKRR
jgi:hypothetical protein